MKPEWLSELEARVQGLIQASSARMVDSVKCSEENLRTFKGHAKSPASPSKAPHMPTPMLGPRISQRAAVIGSSLKGTGAIFTIRPLGSDVREVLIEKALQRALDMALFSAFIDEAVLNALLSPVSAVLVQWVNTDKQFYGASHTGPYVGFGFSTVTPNNFISYPCRGMDPGSERIIGHRWEALAGDLKDMISSNPTAWEINPEDVDDLKPNVEPIVTTYTVIKSDEAKTEVQSTHNDDRKMTLYDLNFRGTVDGKPGVWRLIVSACHKILLIDKAKTSYAYLSAYRSVDHPADPTCGANTLREIEDNNRHQVNRAQEGMEWAMFPLVLASGATVSQLPGAGFRPGTIWPIKSIGQITQIKSGFDPSFIEAQRAIAHEYADASANTPDTIIGSTTKGSASRSATNDSIKREGFTISSNDQAFLLSLGLIQIAKAALAMLGDNWAVFKKILGDEFSDLKASTFKRPLIIEMSSTSLKRSSEARTQQALTLLELIEKIPELAQVMPPLEVALAIISEMDGEFVDTVTMKLQKIITDQAEQAMAVENINEMNELLGNVMGDGQSFGNSQPVEGMAELPPAPTVSAIPGMSEAAPY